MELAAGGASLNSPLAAFVLTSLIIEMTPGPNMAGNIFAALLLAIAAWLSSAPAVDALAPVSLPSFFRLLVFTQRRNRAPEPT